MVINFMWEKDFETSLIFLGMNMNILKAGHVAQLRFGGTFPGSLQEELGGTKICVCIIYVIYGGTNICYNILVIPSQTIQPPLKNQEKYLRIAHAYAIKLTNIYFSNQALAL